MRWRLFALLVTLALAPLLAAGQTAPAQKPPAKEKKVWTNDDLDALHDHGTVSVVGQGQAAPAGKTEKSLKGEKKKEEAKTPYDKTKDPKAYQERLAPLRDQLDQIDRRIKELQDYVANPTTGAGMTLGGSGLSLSPQNEIDQLRQRRAKVQQQIDDIEEEARRNGIAPGSVR